MESRIRRTAIKFYKSLHGKPESKKIIAALKKNGYDVIFYNTPDGDAAVRSYNLQALSERRPAFTYCGVTKIVFISNNLSALDKRNALLHEAGHIMLGHIGDGTSHLLDNRITEAEADAFMLEVLKPTFISPFIMSVIIFLIVCIAFLSFYYDRTTAPASFLPIQTSEELVYITPTGTKYHTEDCMHTKDKNCAKITKTQADIIFSPCSVCNP